MSQEITLNQTHQDDQALDTSAQEGTWEGHYIKPAVDIFESETGLTLVAELPGIKREDIALDLDKNTLTLTARAKTMEPRWRPLLIESEPAHFMRQFKLGDQLAQEHIKATFEDGVLTLELPRSSAQPPRQITIS